MEHSSQDDDFITLLVSMLNSVQKQPVGMEHSCRSSHVMKSVHMDN